MDILWSWCENIVQAGIKIASSILDTASQWITIARCHLKKTIGLGIKTLQKMEQFVDGFSLKDVEQYNGFKEFGTKRLVVYNNTVWSKALEKRDADCIKKFLKHLSKYVSEVGGPGYVLGNEARMDSDVPGELEKYKTKCFSNLGSMLDAGCDYGIEKIPIFLHAISYSGDIKEPVIALLLALDKANERMKTMKTSLYYLADRINQYKHDVDDEARKVRLCLEKKLEAKLEHQFFEKIALDGNPDKEVITYRRESFEQAVAFKQTQYEMACNLRDQVTRNALQRMEDFFNNYFHGGKHESANAQRSKSTGRCLSCEFMNYQKEMILFSFNSSEFPRPPIFDIGEFE